MERVKPTERECVAAVRQVHRDPEALLIPTEHLDSVISLIANALAVQRIEGMSL